MRETSLGSFLFLTEQLFASRFSLLRRADRPSFACGFRRCITSGDSKIAFLLRPPLYYACVSTWREPESVVSSSRPNSEALKFKSRPCSLPLRFPQLRVHLEYLHLQVLSIITGGQLKRIFTRRGNFDLRRLLEGTSPRLFPPLLVAYRLTVPSFLSQAPTAFSPASSTPSNTTSASSATA